MRKLINQHQEAVRAASTLTKTFVNQEEIRHKTTVGSEHNSDNKAGQAKKTARVVNPDCNSRM